jgi:hypothetical protein
MMFCVVDGGGFLWFFFVVFLERSLQKCMQTDFNSNSTHLYFFVKNGRALQTKFNVSRL